jgi:hypothetical protein
VTESEVKTRQYKLCSMSYLLSQLRQWVVVLPAASECLNICLTTRELVTRTNSEPRIVSASISLLQAPITLTSDPSFSWSGRLGRPYRRRSRVLPEVFTFGGAALMVVSERPSYRTVERPKTSAGCVYELQCLEREHTHVPVEREIRKEFLPDPQI